MAISGKLFFSAACPHLLFPPTFKGGNKRRETEQAKAVITGKNQQGWRKPESLLYANIFIPDY
ncbi:hypothetical protein HYX10_03470 [Candidatus Woesearchaeota archaeon]|nr:hypothetical protein [Candidatus Woesearchaeota archaeon]